MLPANCLGDTLAMDGSLTTFAEQTGLHHPFYFEFSLASDEEITMWMFTGSSTDYNVAVLNPHGQVIFSTVFTYYFKEFPRISTTVSGLHFLRLTRVNGATTLSESVRLRSWKRLAHSTPQQASVGSVHSLAFATPYEAQSFAFTIPETGNPSEVLSLVTTRTNNYVKLSLFEKVTPSANAGDCACAVSGNLTWEEKIEYLPGSMCGDIPGEVLTEPSCYVSPACAGSSASRMHPGVNTAPGCIPEHNLVFTSVLSTSYNRINQMNLSPGEYVVELQSGMRCGAYTTCTSTMPFSFTFAIGGSYNATTPAVATLGSRLTGRINRMGEVASHSLYITPELVSDNASILIDPYSCCPSGYIYFFDMDFVAPNGTVIAGAGLGDYTQFWISPRVPGNHTIRIRAYGSGSDSRITSSGQYHFTAYERRSLSDTRNITLALGESVGSSVSTPGSIAIVRFTPDVSAVGHNVSFVLGQFSQSRFDARVGFYIQEDAVGAENLACRCLQPPSENDTFGYSCAFHRTSDQFPWCYVGSECFVGSAASWASGQHYMNGCIPGMTKFREFTTTSTYYRLRSMPLPYHGDYAVVVDEYRNPGSTFTYTSSFVLGMSEPLGSDVQHISYGARTDGSINYIGDVDDYTFYGEHGDAILIRTHDCCPGGYIYYVDVDVLAPNGTVLAGHSAQDNGQLLVSSLPVTGNYTIRISAYGTTTHSYVDDTGRYYFTVWKRTTAEHAHAMTLGSQYRTSNGGLGSRAIIDFNVTADDVNKSIQIVVGHLSHGSFNVKMGLHVLSTADGTHDLSCRCIQPTGLGTFGGTCAFHRTNDQYPWCYVNSSCSSAISAGSGLHYLDDCIPGYTWVRGVETSSNYYRIETFKLSWEGNYAVSVMESRCPSCLFEFTSSFTLGLSRSLGVVEEYIPMNQVRYGAIDFVGDVDDYIVYGQQGDALVVRMHDCCPSGYLYYVDMDFLAPNGTVLAGTGNTDHNQLHVSGLPESANYTIRIRTYGSPTHSYVDDVGDYFFRVSNRSVYQQWDVATVGSSTRSGVLELGSRAVIGFTPQSEDIGKDVPVVVGLPTNSRFEINIGVFINASAVGADEIACRCIQPYGVDSTWGSTCGWHRISDMHMWCYVDVSCSSAKTASWATGLYYNDNCLPDMTLVASATSSSAYYRLLGVPLLWPGNYAVGVRENRFAGLFDYTSNFTVGMGPTSLSDIEPIRGGVLQHGTIAYVGDVRYYSVPADADNGLLLRTSRPSGNMQTDIDIMDPVGNIVAGAGLDDTGDLFIPVLPVSGNYTIQVRARGSATSSYVDDTGEFSFTVWASNGVREVYAHVQPDVRFCASQPYPGFMTVLEMSVEDIAVGSQLLVNVTLPDLTGGSSLHVAVYDANFTDLQTALPLASSSSMHVLAYVPESDVVYIVVSDPARVVTGEYCIDITDRSPPNITMPDNFENIQCSDELFEGDYGNAVATHPRYTPSLEERTGTPPFGCMRVKLWIASTPHTTFIKAQYFASNDTESPALITPAVLTIPCGFDLLVEDVFATDNCGGSPHVSYQDLSAFETCPQIIERIWTAVDSCGNTFNRSQTLQISATSTIIFPEQPRRGALNVVRRTALRWSDLPLADSFDVWLWVTAEGIPTDPLFVNVTSTTLALTDPLVDGTEYSWRVDVRLPGTIIRSDAEWTFTTRPLPDMVVSAVSGSAVTFTGETLSVSWTVTNEGKTGADVNSWWDNVYLSEQPEFSRTSNPRPIRLGAVRNPSYLIQAASYRSTLSYNIPLTWTGKFYYVFVVSDEGQTTNDIDFTNNLDRTSTRVEIQASPSPDLVPVALVPPEASFSGELIFVRWVVENAGLGPTPDTPWYDLISVSDPSNSRRRSSKRELHSAGILRPGDQYSTTTYIRVPEGVSGNQSLSVHTDDTRRVYERLRDGNNEMSVNFSVILSPPPDFEVTRVVVPSVTIPSSSVDILYTVSNRGPGDPWEPVWYDLVTCFVTTADHLQIRREMTRAGQLPVGSSYTASVRVAFPDSMTGAVRCNVSTNVRGTVRELADDIGSNNVTSDEITVLSRSADLTPYDIEVDFQHKWLHVSYSVATTDLGLLDTWTDRVVLSVPSQDANITLLTRYMRYSTASYTRYRQRVTLNYEQDLYGEPCFIFIEANSAGDIREIDYTNNIAATPMMLLPALLPDLSPEYISSPAVAFAGSTISVQYRVKNWGNVEVGRQRWNDVLVLQDQSSTGQPAIQIGLAAQNSYVPILGTYMDSVRVQLPTFCFGTFTLMLATNVFDSVPELSRGNNNISTTIQCELQPVPDIQGVTVNASVIGTALVELEWTSTNVGQSLPGSAHVWTDTCFLSEESDPEDSDIAIALGSFPNNLPLVAGQTWTTSKFISVPASVDTSKLYYVVCFLDSSNDINEGAAGENNNYITTVSTIDLAGVTVGSGGGWTTQRDADLAVVNVSLENTAVSRGRLSVQFSVMNVGDVATTATTWFDSVVLSLDDAYDAIDDFVLFPSAQRVGSLGAGDVYDVDITATIPMLLRNQSVFLFYITDIAESTSDEDRTNNVWRVNDEPFDLTELDLPDLQSQSILVHTVAYINSRVEITVCMNNTGNDTAVAPWHSQMLFSDDLIVDGSDARLASIEIDQDVEPGDNVCFSHNLTLNSGRVAIGDGFLLHVVDSGNVITESNEGRCALCSCSRLCF